MQDALCRGRSTATLDAMNSYAAVVTAYGTLPSERESSRAKLKSFLKWFETRKSIEEVINAAVLRNHPHQNCLSRAKREVVAGNLVAAGAALQAANSFGRLFEIVQNCVRPPFKRADLFVYDVALRIGAYRRLLPTDVYLHSGALVGAQRALGRKNLPRALSPDSFPESFQSLSPHEIEDCLCIFKDRMLPS